MRDEDPKNSRKVIGKLATDELAKLVRLALEQESADPLAAPKPEPLDVPEIDPALFEVPMFMPALVRTEKGDLVLAPTGEALPPRGDPDIEVGRLEGISTSDAEKLAEAGIKTAGDLLARPQELNRILGLRMAAIKKILNAARTGDVQDAAGKRSTREKKPKK